MAVTIPSLRPAPAAPHESRGRRLIDYWPLAPVLLGVALLALPTLAYPFGPDQAIFATIGDAINRGHMPYVDAWDQKPPAIYLWYALALRLPGDLMARVRLLDAVWTVATIVLLYELARSMWSVRAATFAALLYGVIYFTTQGWWYLAQPDGLIGLPLLLAFLLYRRAVGPRRWAFCLAAGALAGIAFQLRFIVAPMLPLFALTDLWERRDAIRRVVERVLWLSLGFALVQAALIAYLAAGDALREYLAATQFASGYVSTGWPYAPAKRTFVGYLPLRPRRGDVLAGFTQPPGAAGDRQPSPQPSSVQSRGCARSPSWRSSGWPASAHSRSSSGTTGSFSCPCSPCWPAGVGTRPTAPSKRGRGAPRGRWPARSCSPAA
ncbi:MAG: glycosyltransferase family 39 protein [Dehalococcoidia bacterium]